MPPTEMSTSRGPARFRRRSGTPGAGRFGGGPEPSPRLVGGLDAADGDEHEPVAGPFPQAFEDLERAAFERGAGQPPGTRLLDVAAGQPGAGDRGVGRDDAVEAERERQVG